MALLGTYNWDPIGESMWGIAQKLTHRNQLNWAELKRLLGAKGPRSFVSRAAQNPDDSNNFHLPGLAISTGWSPDVFHASFSDQYRPFWMSNERSSGFSLAPSVRFCPACSQEGVHLCVHQFLVVDRCPVHRIRLTTRCRYCNRPGRSYALEKLHGLQTTCEGCGRAILNSAADPLESSLNDRLRVLDEYFDWVGRLEKTLNDRSLFLPIGGFSNERHLAYATQLVPGPDWVPDCVDNSRSIRTRIHHWAGGEIKQPKTCRPFELAKLTRPYGTLKDGRTAIPDLAVDIQRLLANEVQRLGKDLFRRFSIKHPSCSVFEYDANRCGPVFGESHNAWAAAWWFWRRSLDVAYPKNQSWRRQRDLAPFHGSWLWNDWVHAVGPIAWSPTRDLQNAQNLIFVRWLTTRWVHRVLKELYAQFVGVACSTVGGFGLETDCLEGHATAIADEGSWWIQPTTTGANIAFLSTIAPLSQFERLYKVGFTGLDESLPESFEKFDPLIELLRMPGIAVAKWRETWIDVRSRHEQRPTPRPQQRADL